MQSETLPVLCLPHSLLQYNITSDLFVNFTSDHNNTSDVNQSLADGRAMSDESYNTTRKVLKGLHTVICLFGLLGNTLTMFILTRKRLKMAVDGTERTVHIGLTALAVSDFLFCLTLLPYGLMDHNTFSFSSRSFQLIYETFSNALINTFLLTSAWLTVTIATGRYLAICHPFRARLLINMTGTKTTVCLVFAVCVLFNIPRLFENQIDSVDCQDGRRAYFRNYGHFERSQLLATVYKWIYFIVGIVLPLAILAYCNFCLAKVLHKSVKIRRESRVTSSHVDANYRITSILVTIVVMYITLVSPSEIFRFIQERQGDYQINLALTLTVEVTNLLQMINFSCNFILYFVLNLHFRRAMRNIFCRCSSSESQKSSKTVRQTHHFRMVAQQSTV